ncbi:MAG: Ribosomal subunit interface protein [Geminicoccaceae bacterium]|jgi:ribosome-associated translation inhibitor RaiA|nr:Ribosomal subunit interface protein [Geminicoccaceae bacterium]
MGRDDRTQTRKASQQRRQRRDTFAAAVPKGQKRVTGRSTTRETPLHIRVRGGDVDDALREYMRRRTGFKLGKHALHVSRITVRIDDVAGPKGAPSYACRFKVMLPGTREVVVSALDSTVRAAFDTAVDATERAVRRVLQRVRAR